MHTLEVMRTLFSFCWERIRVSGHRSPAVPWRHFTFNRSPEAVIADLTLVSPAACVFVGVCVCVCVLFLSFALSFSLLPCHRTHTFCQSGTREVWRCFAVNPCPSGKAAFRVLTPHHQKLFKAWTQLDQAGFLRWFQARCYGTVVIFFVIRYKYLLSIMFKWKTYRRWQNWGNG